MDKSFNSDIKYCSHCGSKNASFAKYCATCGYEMPVIEEFAKQSINSPVSTQKKRPLKQDSSSAIRFYKRKSFIRFIIFLILISLFALTNPKDADHLNFVKGKIQEKIDQGETMAPELVKQIKSGKMGVDSDQPVRRKDYILFSLTEVKVENDYAVIAIGLLGSIFDLEKMDNFLKRPEGIVLIIFGIGLFIWLFPVLIILFSGKITVSEKIGWILAVIFISWFAFIFYLLFAPIKKKN